MTIKLESYLNNNVLMCVEQLKPILRSFRKSCIIVLVYKKGSPHCEIIPSLCAYQTENGEFFSINSIHQLYSITLNVDIESIDKNIRKHKSEFHKRAKENNFEAYNYQNLCIAIFIKNNKNISAEKITKLAHICNTIRQKSLNILNDSINYSVEDWNYLKSLLHPSIHVSAKAFKNYLNDRLNLPTSVYINKDKKWVLFNENYENPINLEENIAESHLLEKDQQLVFSKKLVYGFYEKSYYLIIPFATQRSKKYQKLKIVFFIKNKNPIPYYVAINTTNFIDRFFNEYLIEYKINHLLELEDKINDLYMHSNDLHFKYNQELLNLFSKFTKDALDIVVETTNAFSATCRLFDIKSKTLKRIVYSESNVDRIIDINNSNEISINNHKSVNVKVWKDAYKLSDGNNTIISTKKPFIYIPDTDKYYSIKHRENVKSELCIPLFFKGTRIGTINIESPVQDGLRDSINYIQGVAKSIGSYYSHLWDLNDKFWICRRSEHEQNTHELLGLINRKDILIPDILKRKIQELISTHTIEISEEKKDLSILDNCRERIIRELIENNSEAFLAPFKNGCKININTKNVKIDSYKAGILKIIYSNLLSNFRNYGNPETDTLFISYEGHERHHIIFHIKSKAFLEEDLTRATVSPIPNNDEIKPEKWGLLLTGILVRHLGGFIYLDNIKGSKSIIKAIIPLTNGETYE